MRTGGGFPRFARVVSVLFNEPKLLKLGCGGCRPGDYAGFSALQRAEIAEIPGCCRLTTARSGFSALQRAEIAEIRNAASAGASRALFQCSSTSRNC